MDISVVICTYNRSRHLNNILNSLVEQEVSEELLWEIVVIDNNSVDDTKDVVKGFELKTPIPVKYFTEEKQGLSHARNRGIVESKGKYVAFTDDDAIAGKNWVASLHQGLVKYGCECVGGKIFLKTDKELPGWLSKELWGFLGYLDYGDEEINFDNVRYPFGGNMVFARDFFAKTGYFNPNYGRTGNKDFGGDEYELFTRFLASGGKGMYIPAAIVYHVIGPEKLQKQYFRKLHFRAGEQKALNESVEYKRTVYGIPLFIFPQLFRSTVKYILKPTMRMQMNVWWIIGFIRGRRDIYSLKK